MTEPVTFRINYDDQLIDVVDKVNAALEEAGIAITFEDDGEDHDGFMIYTLTEDEGNEASP